MQSVQGIVTIVQEGRFQLLDDSGVAHHFLLSHRAAAGTGAIARTAAGPGSVRVWYQRAPDLIGHVAARIDLLDDKPSMMHPADAQMAPPSWPRARESV